ncbi:ParB N-terminal domain-containing protein [Burkholderia gladioli]|uniref:ParB N-terminal domain-containing protein n=1 Tax=Burkholderia gladioli TaxID=28095 RepID=UPI00163F66CB|nr:ParB N-terminal domain-containing protein [Burkholderia gladioli]
MKHARIEVPLIKRSSSARATNQGVVESLAASMQQVGLLQPITVKASKVFDGIMVDGYFLVAGNHRFLAAQKLGWEHIDAIVVEGSALEAELIEIDENLCRAELTPAQRTASIARRKQIWEALHPEIQVAQVEPPEIGYAKPPKQEKAFAAEPAVLTGQSKSDINRHVARAEALGDDIERLVGTSLDKGVELDALKAMPEPARKEVIERAVSGEKVSARSILAAQPKPQSETPQSPVTPRWVNAMLTAIDQLERTLQAAVPAPRIDCIDYLQCQVEHLPQETLEAIATREEMFHRLYMLTQTIRGYQGEKAAA